YCSRKVRMFMEGLSSYAAGDWAEFCNDIWCYYKADQESKYYRVSDLENLVKRAENMFSFRALSIWREYSQKFMRIAGWLLTKDTS
ncbi:hypothetical protein OBBRIDRAFT_741050, partial [Obba rivulosa]